jgi:hypothetical protein
LKYRPLRRFIFVLLILGLGIVLFQFVRLPFLPVRLHEAVPNSTAVMLQFENTNEIDNILETEGNLFETQRIQKEFSVFANIFPTQKNGQLLAALRAPDLDFLYVKKRVGRFKLKEEIAKLKPETVREIDFHGHLIYNVQVSEDESINITRFRNLLIFARESYLVEESVTQLKDYWGSLRGEKYFRRVERTEIPDAAAYVYVNFKNVPTQLVPYLGLKKANDIANFGNWVNWLKLGLIPSETGYQLNGAVTGELKFLKHLNSIQDGNIFKILPDNLAVLMWMEAPLVGKFSAEFQQYFQPWISGEIAYANLEPFGAKNTAEKFLVVKSTDTKLSEKLLADLGSAMGKLESYDYQMFHIEQLLADDVLMPVFGKRLNPIKNPYYTVLEDFVIFCNSRKAIEIWLDKYLIGKTLGNDIPFLQIQQSQPDDRKVHLSLNFSKLSLLLEEYVRPEYRKEFAEITAIYTEFGLLSLGLYPQGQRSLVGGEIYRLPKGKIDLNTNLPKSSNAEVVWKAEFNSKVLGAPNVIKDVASKENRILIQTENNVLHCLTEGGEKLWTASFSSPILSEIIPIQNSKSQQTQLLFNTEKAIYLYNIDGTEAQTRLKVKSKMANGVLAVDFDNNEEYSIFVASKNKNIYGFTLAGEPLNGWNPLRKRGAFAEPLQHFSTAEKDFILGVNDKGILHVFQRNGQDRFPHPIKIRKGYVTSPAYDTHPDMTRIIALDETGRLTVVNTEGESFSLNVKTGEKQEPRLLFKDVVGDKRKDYIVLNNKELSVWTYEGKEFKKVQNFTFEKAPNDLFDPRKGIGVINEKAAEINLFLKPGERHSDFPLGGTTPFVLIDLLEDGKTEVVVGNGTELYVYELSE